MTQGIWNVDENEFYQLEAQLKEQEQQAAELKELKRKEAMRTAKGRAEKIKKLEAIVQQQHSNFRVFKTSYVHKQVMTGLQSTIDNLTKQIAKMETYKNKEPLYFLECKQQDWVIAEIHLAECMLIKTKLSELRIADWPAFIEERKKHFTDKVISWAAYGGSHSSSKESNVVEDAKYAAFAQIVGGYGDGLSRFTYAIATLRYCLTPDEHARTYIYNDLEEV